MARMWPQKIPPDVTGNPLRAAEIRVYNRLQHQLDDSWVVFYSRPWLGLSPTGEEIDGECDFVIAHAQYGMLCVEVKGGQVSWDPREDRWTSVDRYGITHRIKDPVAQARSSKYHLLEKLKETPGLGKRWLRVRHGVILPDCMAPPRDMGPDRPRFIFCFEREFATDLAGWAVARFANTQEQSEHEQALGLDGVKALEALFATPLTLKIPLGHTVRSEDEQLEFLTQQQYHLLGAMDSLERVAVQGGAGTGKTILAAHLANRLAGSGLRTLLVCYNEALASRLAHRYRGAENLQVCSFHALCFKSLDAVGQRMAVPEDNRSHFFEVTLPEALVDFSSAPEMRHFDAIVVDEGQDFRELWWIALDSLLANDGPKLLRVFLDCNQRVYASAVASLRNMKLLPFHLSWNLRNTREVHKAVYQYYSGREVSCNGPEGEPPAYVVVGADSSVREELGELVGQLVGREALLPEEIAVVVPDARWVGQLAPAGAVGGVPTQDASREEPGYLTLDTIRRFKGLESRVLIVVVDDNLVTAPELCYVALSRGRTRVFLLGSEECLGRLKEV